MVFFGRIERIQFLKCVYFTHLIFSLQTLEPMCLDIYKTEHCPLKFKFCMVIGSWAKN